MSALGVHNCLVLIGVAGMGLRTVIGEPFTELVEKFLFAMHRFCLTGASHMACLLAFNRFCVLTEWFSAPKIFYATAITLDFAYICAQIGMFLTAYASVIYNAELATNYFDEDLPLTTYLDNFDCFLGLGIMTSALIMYVVIVAVLLLKRFSLTTIENRAPIASREVAILIQSMAEFTFEICLLLNAITLVKFIPHVYWATGSFVIFCILGSGWMSPLMYLMMNKTLRKQLFALIKRMNLTKVSPSNLLFRSSSTSYRY
ncbi:hypothetical protein L596_029125 [Steinernema carpocapsae]|uniref:7TM GPCR serpentine receptor class x (Srx) domain-containing protein n=1 Tax=Steinernema carpocapsae TaxID=34508 RepID=A0A4U5LTR1_STECR|nr:hypothetical protein L596_029125 [Steinernema carpocapsae]